MKQSGQPASGAAENSSRSKSSSQLRSTRVSASRKTHLENLVSLQQWSLVKVMPSSGLSSRARLAASLLSITLTSTTSSNTVRRMSLHASGTKGWEWEEEMRSL